MHSLSINNIFLLFQSSWCTLISNHGKINNYIIIMYLCNYKYIKCYHNYILLLLIHYSRNVLGFVQPLYKETVRTFVNVLDFHFVTLNVAHLKLCIRGTMVTTELAT